MNVRMPVRLRLWQPVVFALAALAGGAVGCGDDPTPLPPDPPRVTVAPVGTSVADTHLAVNITVSGCEAVKALSLWNRDVHVTDVAWTQNPTRVEIQPNQLRYHDGLAADLALVARVTCDDDRQNASSPAGVRFLPVAEVLRAAPGGQVVTDVFWADGLDANVGFIGCSGSPSAGNNALVRVNRQGEVVAFNNSLPFPCTAALWVTDLHLESFKRWAVEPGVGAFAFNPGTLQITGQFLGGVQNLTVGPDGDALLYTAGGGTEALHRVHHEAPSLPAWSYTPAGFVMGNVGIHPTLGIYLPVWMNKVGQYQGTVGVERVAYDSGANLSQPVPMKIVQYGLGDAPPIPPAAFSADASLVYFPFQTAAGQSTVIACATNPQGEGCSGGNLAWQRTLPGNVMLTVPFNQNALLAAVAPQHTWFLDAATGNVLNRDGLAVQPEGSLVTMGVLPGQGREFYLLNGSGLPGTFPSELVAVDDPSFGVLYRYAAHGTTLMAGLDDSGQAWLRVGPDLVKPLPLVEYQLVVGR